MIGIGMYAFVDKWQLTGWVKLETVYDVILNVSLVMVIMGGVVFVVSFAGCVGALRENTCLLKFVRIKISNCCENFLHTDKDYNTNSDLKPLHFSFFSLIILVLNYDKITNSHFLSVFTVFANLLSAGNGDCHRRLRIPSHHAVDARRKFHGQNNSYISR